jgi:benzoate transport
MTSLPVSSDPTGAANSTSAANGTGVAPRSPGANSTIAGAPSSAGAPNTAAALCASTGAAPSSANPAASRADAPSITNPAANFADVPTSADVRNLIGLRPMTACQVIAVAVCVGLNMLDGFDVLVMSFTASGVSLEWNLSGARLGLLLSAGLVGMAAGSLFLAPRADRIGRRIVVMVCVAIVSLGMLLSAFARGFAELALLRAVTGIGIGGILASATVLVAEYSSERWRNTASCLYTAGYSLGATAGGAIAALLIGRYGWRSAFVFGAVLSFCMLPAVYWGLPESLDFLITRRPAAALAKVNRLLRRMRRGPLPALPAVDDPLGQDAAASLRRLWSPTLATPTVLIWITFFFLMAGYYFVYGWTPRLLTAAGMSAAQGITSGVLLSLGGIVGTVSFAFLARGRDMQRLTQRCLLAAGVLTAVFAFTTTKLTLALGVGLVLGGLANSAMAGLYALTPTLYPPSLRATGMGWAIGIGRSGAILAPTVTGLLVDQAWKPPQLYLAFAGTFLIAMAALTRIFAPGRLPAPAPEPAR